MSTAPEVIPETNRQTQRHEVPGRERRWGRAALVAVIAIVAAAGGAYYYRERAKAASHSAGETRVKQAEHDSDDAIPV